MRIVRAWIGAALSVAAAVAVAACGPATRRPPDDLDGELTARPTLRREVYTLWWNGARIGDVEEEVRSSPDAIRVIRRERIAVTRGDRLAVARVELTIDADPDLRARSVRADAWTEDGATTSRATRAGDAWRVEVDGEPPRTLDGALVPAELVPLLLARDGGFDGDVVLAGRGFAAARLRVAPADAPRTYRAIATIPGGALATTIELDRDGVVLRAAGDDGVVAVLATPADVAAPFDPPEVVEATAIRVAGAVPEGAARLHLALAPVTRPLPPALPGQDLAADGDRWGAILDPALPGALPPGEPGPDRAEAIAALVREVDARLVEDLGATAPTIAAARRAAAGDCTTHALLLAALAADAGIDVRLVTGFRVDGGRMVRHRWAIAWTGSRWIAVDPTYGQAPARSFLLGLAIHGARADELALADDAAFAGTGGARAKLQPTP